MRLVRESVAEGQRSEAAREGHATCGGGEGRPRRWRIGLVCAGIALAVAGAYGMGWIGETPLVLLLAAVVLYARAKLGWFG